MPRDYDLNLGSGHTVVHHSSTHTYVPNFTEIRGKNFQRSHLNFLPSSRSRDTKTRIDTKIWIKQIYILSSNLRISICQLPWKMAKEIDFENGRISNFQHHVTLTLDWAMWHSVINHRLLPTNQISFELEKLLWTDGQTYVRTYVWTYVWMDVCMYGWTYRCTYGQTYVRTDRQTSRPALLGRLSRGVRLKFINRPILLSLCTSYTKYHSAN